MYRRMCDVLVATLDPEGCAACSYCGKGLAAYTLPQYGFPKGQRRYHHAKQDQTHFDDDDGDNDMI
jgi:hypothetical protein